MGKTSTIRWIGINDEKPCDDEDVLIIVEYADCSRVIYKATYCEDDCFDYICGTVLYWAELPDLIKIGGE